jgi:3-hydroxyisobutyrate dehydrogenase
MPLTTGFIGLGAMGAHMARNLHQRSLLTSVWNRSPAKAQTLAAELGVHCANSIADLADHADVIVTCVAADADVLQIVDALLPHLQPNSIVIDCSTVSADTARTAAHRLAERDIGFLDAPVSGGVEGARQGTLAIMVGGEAEVFARAKPVLDAMGTTITHFGDTGSGQAAKATNQLMCAGIIQAISEAMAFAKAEGLPLDKIVDTLGKGAGSSWYFVNRAPNMVKGEYPAGFRVQLHQKDLKICREMAARHGVQLPLIEMTLVHYRRLIDQGFGDDDISTLFRLKDDLFSR